MSISQQALSKAQNSNTQLESDVSPLGMGDNSTIKSRTRYFLSNLVENSSHLKFQQFQSHSHQNLLQETHCF